MRGLVRPHALQRLDGPVGAVVLALHAVLPRLAQRVLGVQAVLRGGDSSGGGGRVTGAPAGIGTVPVCADALISLEYRRGAVPARSVAATESPGSRAREPHVTVALQTGTAAGRGQGPGGGGGG